MSGRICRRFSVSSGPDSACHGWIDRRAAEGTVTHLAMEAEFDRLLMERDDLVSLGRSYLPPHALRRGVRRRRPAYQHTSPKQLEEGYRSMRDTALFARLSGHRLSRPANRAVGALPGLKALQGIFLTADSHDAYAESNEYLTRQLAATVEAAAKTDATLSRRRVPAPRFPRGAPGFWEPSLLGGRRAPPLPTFAGPPSNETGGARFPPWDTPPPPALLLPLVSSFRGGYAAPLSKMGWYLSPGMFLASRSPCRSEWPILPNTRPSGREDALYGHHGAVGVGGDVHGGRPAVSTYWVPTCPW